MMMKCMLRYGNVFMISTTKILLVIIDNNLYFTLSTQCFFFKDLTKQKPCKTLKYKLRY